MCMYIHADPDVVHTCRFSGGGGGGYYTVEQACGVDCHPNTVGNMLEEWRVHQYRMQSWIMACEFIGCCGCEMAIGRAIGVCLLPTD